MNIRTNLKPLIALACVLMVVATPVSGAAELNPRVSPTGEDAVGLIGYDVPDDVVHHGSGEPQPGILVTLESSEDLDSLREWTNASDSRMYLESYNATNSALIAAPMSHVQSPDAAVINPSSALGDSTTLMSLDYTTGWAFNRRVSYVRPISTPAGNDSHTPPRGATYAEAVTGGEYTASGMAYDGDAPSEDMNRTSELVGAESVTADGTGVNVAVIDSGVNFGNGTLYGNGTSGSNMRVADAYDYVDSEGADLSVSRSELPTELDKLEDPNGHGSWVSSSVLNSRSGVAPNATLMTYRALNEDGQGSTADIKKAIARADRNQADILVMSLGSPTHSDPLARELRRALSEDGNVTGAFVAVGNSYQTTRYVSSPGDVDRVIGVSATNAVNASTAKKAYFANIGPDTGADGSGTEEPMNTRADRPDTAAPGMKVSTWVYTDSGRLRTAELSGTSMATPVAAGVGALLLDANQSLNGQPDEFRARMVESGAHTPNIGVTQSRGGMVNATRAINGYSDPAPSRDLTDETAGRDDANRALSGNIGQRMAKLGQWTNTIL